ncbi:alkaline phosphatase D family protein [Armatimonas sp.]|uniref:alkaline phosphatase D family protein n=1 Tax=Armatimonas sp. TaxID=1872638 RepID=UPI00374DAB14
MKHEVAYQATGTRVGEPTATTAVVWVRLTAATRKPGTLADFEGACPGAAGRVRLRYGTREDLSGAQATPWVSVTEATDFTHHFALADLKPATRYFYASESDGSEVRGAFQTAPSEKAPSDFRFCVMTCQGYPDRGHADGHAIYPAMQALSPAFACLTGDLVYYDNDPPRAETPQLARYHWERMFSLPRLLAFNKSVGTYWLKDDHDTLNDDSWPSKTMGSFTFAEGQRIFRQQAPLTNGPSYRTFRWGRDLQIWLTEGRDFRSPNTITDGPEKTILGKAQKEWLKRTLKASDATWKLLISPTPLVGPDRAKKNDNHSNAGFQHEGDELRAWFKANVAGSFFVICGDRHWQYHSVHPETGLNEFSVGAASDEHAAGTPGEDKRYHKFHRVKGGFLYVTVKPGTLLFEHRDIHGSVVYTYTATKN